MSRDWDLVVRGGRVVDGTGGPAFDADVAIDGGVIAQVGRVEAHGRQEIDAAGLLVTPGFVDIHTHYDGQAIWSDRLTPSSWHGVTTAVMGNCGVGFAPCRPDDRDRRSLVRLLEGVEDIPGVVMTEGLTWDWESFPDYLDALARRRRDIDVAAYLPHSALRIYVMGERGARREPATADDIARMAALVEQALEAGAVGFATSRLFIHRTADGDLAPSFDAAEEELIGIAGAMRRAGRGTFQIVVDFSRGGEVAVNFGLARRIAAAAGRPLSFSHAQGHRYSEQWSEILDLAAQANAEGLDITAQFLPRPMGIVIGHTLTANPFSLCPSYARLQALPFEDRIAALRRPEVRASILSEEPDGSVAPLHLQARDFERMFPLTDRPDYEPRREDSMASRARAAGVPVEAYAYDTLLEGDGGAMWFVAFGNYADFNLDAVLAMSRHPNAVYGVGDGGAHYGLVCDATYTTTVLAHWTRDRTRGERMSVEEAVRRLTRAPAQAVGLLDRGLVAPGYKADLNLIDHGRVALSAPFLTYDLPAGGKRLTQRASGYAATIVSGQVTYREGEATGALPGRLVREAAVPA